MQKLTLVIGKAPSEIPFSELLSRLSLERERMSRLAETFRGRGRTKAKAKKKPAKSKKVSQADLAEIAKLTGLSIGDLVK